MGLGHHYNLYLLTNETVGGYDTYDSCIVCAESEEEAKKITPEENRLYSWGKTWCDTPDQVICTYIGKADSSIKVGSAVLASFNAG